MQTLNQHIKTGYWVLIIIPIFYLMVSGYSYFSVLSTFGEVPLPHNTLEELAKLRGLPISIFPIQYGSLLITIVFLCYLIFPVFIFVNYLLHKGRYIVFNKSLFVYLLIVYLSVFLLIRLEIFGWYMMYVLD